MSDKETKNSTKEWFPEFYSLDFYQKRKKGKFRFKQTPGLYKYNLLCDTHCHLGMYEDIEWAFVRCAFHGIRFLACIVDCVDDGYATLKKILDSYRSAQSRLNHVVDTLKNSTDKNINDLYDEYGLYTIKAESSPFLCVDKDSILNNPKLPELRFIVGCHPHYTDKFDSEQLDNLYEMAKHPLVCAIGEVGLDFYYDNSMKERQIEAFKSQIKVAQELKLPLCLHMRDSHELALQVLDDMHWNKSGVLLHCFTLGEDDIKPWIDNDCYIAFGGAATFKHSENIKNAAKLVPKNKLLLETDSPYMTPEPLRGSKCYPDHILYTAQTFIQSFDCVLEDQKIEFLEQVKSNTEEFFKVKI